MVDKSDGGIITITLKGDKEELSFKCHDNTKWNQTKDFLLKYSYDIRKEMTKNHFNVDVEKEKF